MNLLRITPTALKPELYCLFVLFPMSYTYIAVISANCVSRPDLKQRRTRETRNVIVRVVGCGYLLEVT